MSKFLDRIRRSSLRVFTGVDSLVSVNKYGKDNEFYISDEESIADFLKTCSYRLWHLQNHVEKADFGQVNNDDRNSFLNAYFTEVTPFTDCGFIYVVIGNYSKSSSYSGKVYDTIFQLVRAGYVVCILEDLCYLEPNWLIKNHQINWRTLAIRYGVSPDVIRFYQGCFTSTRHSHDLLCDNGFDTPIFIHRNARTGKYCGGVSWIVKGQRPDYVFIYNKYHSNCLAFSISETYANEGISLESIDVHACAEIVADVMRQLDIDHITSIGVASRPAGRYFLMISMDHFGFVDWANVNGELDNFTFPHIHLN